MMGAICRVVSDDFSHLIEIWEASVRATHDFLSETDIARLKPLVMNHYFKAVHLKGYKDQDGVLLAFIGIKDKKIEMLFVHPRAQGQGIGTSLCQEALMHEKVRFVDVNEQNPSAIKFYEKMGFKKIRRSALDGEGRPYPILHMRLRR
jgi:putative acetyltransferase